MNKLQFKPIKTIAGEILLYFYFLQRKNITDLSMEILGFSFKRTPKNTLDGMEISGRDKTFFNNEKFAEYTDVDMFNALAYLSESYFITYNESKSTAGSHIHQIKVTARGIDLIEGIERGQEEKREFNVTFNFNIQNNITVESLLKTELGSIFKASLI